MLLYFVLYENMATIIMKISCKIVMNPPLQYILDSFGSCRITQASQDTSIVLILIHLYLLVQSLNNSEVEDDDLLKRDIQEIYIYIYIQICPSLSQSSVHFQAKAQPVTFTSALFDFVRPFVVQYEVLPLFHHFRCRNCFCCLYSFKP